MFAHCLRALPMSTASPSLLQEACEGVEAATQLLSLLCERVLRSQPALGTADRAALLSAGPRFRRQAAAALVAAQPGGHSWAGALRCWWAVSSSEFAALYKMKCMLGLNRSSNMPCCA